MKYQLLEILFDGETQKIVNVLLSENSGINFPAEKGNPNYDQFLEQTGLTDTEVHELEPDVWYEMLTLTP